MASVIAAARRTWRHLARIRYRLLLVNLAIAVVPIAGITFAHLHERQLLAELEADLHHQAELVRAVVEADPKPLADYGPILAAAAHDTRTRIRLVDATGTIACDSHASGPPEGAEKPVPYLIRGESPSHAATVPKPIDLRDRPEIQAALAGHYGAATRLWEKQDRVYLFIAIPLRRDGIVGAVYVTRSTHDVKVQLYLLRSWLSKLMVVAIAGAALLTLLFATTIVRPLARLTRSAKRIAAHQPAPDTEELARRSDEIGQLARAVAAMTDELERRASDARTLAADISHELKNPLASIRGAAELLREGASDDPDARERFLAMILDDVARLDRAVSRLLELARVEDDRGTAVPVELGGLARAIATRPWPAPVEVACDGDVIASVRGAAITAAIDNLVTNACQHADPGTAVTISIRATRITVANFGPPISRTAQAKIWDRFYTTRAEQGGSGIGLSIVRAVALAHGGSVGVRCADRVTELWLELPA
jgi:two-component system sensor histidine kinase ChvG